MWTKLGPPLCVLCDPTNSTLQDLCLWLISFSSVDGLRSISYQGHHLSQKEKQPQKRKFAAPSQGTSSRIPCSSSLWAEFYPCSQLQTFLAPQLCSGEKTVMCVLHKPHSYYLLIKLLALKGQTFLHITDLYYISLPYLSKKQQQQKLLVWIITVWTGATANKSLIILPLKDACVSICHNLRLWPWLSLHLKPLLIQKNDHHPSSKRPAALLSQTLTHKSHDSMLWLGGVCKRLSFLLTWDDGVCYCRWRWQLLLTNLGRSPGGGLPWLSTVSVRWLDFNLSGSGRFQLLNVWRAPWQVLGLIKHLWSGCAEVCVNAERISDK